MFRRLVLVIRRMGAAWRESGPAVASLVSRPLGAKENGTLPGCKLAWMGRRLRAGCGSMDGCTGEGSTSVCAHNMSLLESMALSPRECLPRTMIRHNGTSTSLGNCHFSQVRSPEQYCYCTVIMEWPVSIAGRGRHRGPGSNLVRLPCPSWEFQKRRRTMAASQLSYTRIPAWVGVVGELVFRLKRPHQQLHRWSDAGSGCYLGPRLDSSPSRLVASDSCGRGARGIS